MTINIIILVCILASSLSQEYTQVFTGAIPSYNLSITASRQMVDQNNILLAQTGSMYCGNNAVAASALSINETWSFNWSVLIVTMLLSTAMTALVMWQFEHYSKDIRQGKLMLCAKNAAISLAVFSLAFGVTSNIIVFFWAPLYDVDYNTDCYYYNQMTSQSSPTLNWNNVPNLLTDCTQNSQYYPQWDATITISAASPVLSNVSGTWYIVQSMKSLRNERCYPFTPESPCSADEQFCNVQTSNIQESNNGCFFSTNIAVATMFRVSQVKGYVLSFNPSTNPPVNITTCQGFTSNCTVETTTAYYLLNPATQYPKGLLYTSNVVIDLNDPDIAARLFTAMPSYAQLMTQYVSGWDLIGNPIYNFQQTTLLPYVTGFECLAQIAVSVNQPLMCLPSQVSYAVDNSGIYLVSTNATTGCSILWTANESSIPHWPSVDGFLLLVTPVPTVLPPGAKVNYIYDTTKPYFVPNATNITGTFVPQIQGVTADYPNSSLSGQLQNQSNTLLFLISTIILVVSGIIALLISCIKRRPMITQPYVIFHEMKSNQSHQ